MEIDYQVDRQPSRIVKKGENTEEFRYLYDVAGNLVEIDWFENQEKKGIISYEYDRNGKIDHLKKYLSENINTTIEEFEFDYLVY